MSSLIYSAPQQPQNTLAALQLKLAQLTSSPQLGQSEQSVVYQQTDEQTYVLPSQDPIEASQIAHVIIFFSIILRSSLLFCFFFVIYFMQEQQSQLNSPTVQIDINQMKLTSTQSSSAVSTPVIEQNETFFPQPSDQPNVSSTVVQPKQLSDLEQELAKIHQKRYNKDQPPLSAPPVEQLLLSNNAPSGNAPNTQAIPTLPINASQSSHTEQVCSVNISIPTASADSNDNTLNIQSQQAVRKISRFQVSVVNEATPSIQVQPQDSTVRTQFLQTTVSTSLLSTNNSAVDEQRFDYSGLNFQNYPNSAGGNGELL